MLTKIFGISEMEQEISELKTVVSALQKTNQGFLEVIECINYSNEELYNKFKYSKWEQLPKALCTYLAKRFGFTFASVYSFSIGPKIFMNECVGETYERYNSVAKPLLVEEKIEKKVKVKKKKK